MSRFVISFIFASFVVANPSYADDAAGVSDEVTFRTASDADMRSKDNEGNIDVTKGDVKKLVRRTAKLERELEMLNAIVDTECAEVIIIEIDPATTPVDPAATAVPDKGKGDVAKPDEPCAPGLLKRVADLEAELDQIRKDLDEQRMQVGANKEGITELEKGYKSLKSQLAVIESEIGGIKNDIKQLTSIQWYTVSGPSAGFVLRPPIPTLAEGIGARAGWTIGFGREDLENGMVVSASAGLASPEGFFLDSSIVRYKLRKKSKRGFAYGGGIGGDSAVYGAFGMPGVDAYSVGARVDGYMRWRLWYNNERDTTMYFVVTPYGKLGKVANSGAGAPEACVGLDIGFRRHKPL
ncbi:MAG: hypothetical protein ABIA47_01635 [bacterium]